MIAFRWASAVLLVLPLVTAGETFTPGQRVEARYADYAVDFLDQHCIDCHDDATKKGGLSLEGIGPVDETNAATWKSVWAQVTLKEMPPKKKDQPAVVDRLRFSDWVVGELEQAMEGKGGFQAPLDPKKGNFVDHELLFGELPDGVQLVPSSSPARLWRVTPQEHITRLNELINTEPAYDPKQPGKRTHGDAVPTNHGGELKLYFGTDRITKHQGGTVAYATAVKSIPVVLSNSRRHGFENYADLHSVNSAEATQILGKAEDILRYMAYGPLSIAKPEQITDDPRSYPFEGDIRGLPTSLVYSTEVTRPLTPIHGLMESGEVREEGLRDAVNFLFEALVFRPPSDGELEQYLEILKETIAKVGKEDGVFMGLSAIFLHRDALFRPELAEAGKPDQFGRVMLQDWELGLAVNHALRYLRPDDQLREAILTGRMRTREDVKREVTRMLNDDSIRKPRVLQFFRDYFDYDLGGYICKDDVALNATGLPRGGKGHYRAMFDATASTDRLIELILSEDREVLKELLTTSRVVATGGDQLYFGRKLSPSESADAGKADKEAARQSVQRDRERLRSLQKRIEKLEAEAKHAPKDREVRLELAKQKKEVAVVKRRIQSSRNKGRGGNRLVAPAELTGPKIQARVSRKSFGSGSMKPDRILATIPEGERLGILTHPAWLVSHSDAMDNHAIHRGMWIRERLLGGGIPDVPITVDAMLPDEPDSTLRERMRVTREKYCWTCHEKMDPLGLPFEMYNHVGIYRIEDLTQPVDTSGEIIDSGEAGLDGPVTDAIEMIRKLAESERVEQVFVRHAFRFWMGRNETIHDRAVLQDAYRAYRDNGGSMNALITSLVTSDAFLYRRRD